jgi:hypothetical protein
MQDIAGLGLPFGALVLANQHHTFLVGMKETGTIVYAYHIIQYMCGNVWHCVVLCRCALVNVLNRQSHEITRTYMHFARMYI